MPLLASCTYMKSAAKQSSYARIQEENPSQRNLKHMIDRQTFLVYGRIVDESNSFAESPLAVAAFSNRYFDNELVDFTPVARAGTQYGMNLPDGSFVLLVFADRDQNGVLDQTEVVGRRDISLSVATHADMVVPDIDIQLSGQLSVDWVINLPMPQVAKLEESLFYPNGSIRQLNDPLFDADIAALGLYEPAAFLELAPTMFYALEEDSYKIPVVFVHGIGGSARDFAAIVPRLDKRRFKAWFFYYPSGSDLEQMGEVFYSIFLSGQAVPAGSKPMIVVAHSMGGLVVREAMNKYRGTEEETPVPLFISIATPFGGHPAAAKGEKHGPMVLPSWRDLNPDGAFIDQLFTKPLPGTVDHRLLYAYRNPDGLKMGENSDGVVPLSSQLHPAAQRQAAMQFGFNSSHTGVLQDEAVIQLIVESIDEVGSYLRASHLDALMEGGYDVELNDTYSDMDKYFVRTLGKFMALLANGTLDPLGEPTLEHFVAVAQGREAASTDAEKAWLKFSYDYPDYALVPDIAL